MTTVRHNARIMMQMQRGCVYFNAEYDSVLVRLDIVEKVKSQTAIIMIKLNYKSLASSWNIDPILFSCGIEELKLIG